MIDWRHWHNEPYLVGGLVLLGWLWAVLAGPWRGRHAPAGTTFPHAQAWKFYTSLVVFFFAVASPLDQIGERFLFSAHMFQHQLLVYPAAMLFLLGLPSWMIDAALARPAVRAVARLLTRPVCAILGFAVVLGVWHGPPFYEAALEHKLLHVAEHLMFFGAAVVYWWPVFSPSRVLPALPHGAQMLYLLAGTIAMMPLYAYITFSGDVLYPTYEFAPRLFANFSAAADQLLAGVGMQAVSVAVTMSVFAWAFYRWFQAGERTKKNAPKP